MARENTSITIDPELKAKAKAFRLNLSDICSKAIQAEVNKLESPDMVLLKAKEIQEKASIAVANAEQDKIIAMIKDAGLPLSAFWKKQIPIEMSKYPSIKLSLDELIEIAQKQQSAIA